MRWGREVKGRDRKWKVVSGRVKLEGKKKEDN